jgi:hypothetical protein
VPAKIEVILERRLLCFYQDYAKELDFTGSSLMLSERSCLPSSMASEANIDIMTVDYMFSEVK